ncbi:hypothetical protein N7468_008351 [Penicillium chermesinum]|uniref:Uncharacterized protein n=1 Tax=Penicillium chermesinum TaxID=63820 RepID=A0A9W9NSF7_9EURO|nr:uncharacterized protein N7468_008351 [Penicillium chermesinum]KAJ5223809.1 hypothetical protein N7468_008351 [Penicillium chermesinum]
MASIQFVLSVPHPGGTVGITDAQRRAAHSHAARIRHAKARRSRTIHHQAQKRDTSQNLEGVKGGTDPQKDTIDLRICRALSAGRKDPFMSFALLLSPLEHWLFDHCNCCPIKYLTWVV